MLGKLIKHEFRATGRIMLPIMAAVLLLALLANLSIAGLAGQLSDIPVLRIVFTLIVIFFVVAIIATGVMAMVIMVSRFYRNLLKDEGYLMMTLPVSVHEHVWAKLIVSLVWFLAAGLLTFLVISATGLNLSHTSFDMIIENFPSFAEIREFLTQNGIFGQVIGLFFQGILVVILGVIFNCLHFYSAMALGHMFSKDKILLSIVFYVAISFLVNLINMTYGGIFGGMNIELYADSFEALEGASGALKMMSGFFWHILILEVVQSAILYLGTVLGLKRGLNLG